MFVSCGQVTETEKDLGRRILALVQETPGLTAYFAQEVSSLEALSSNIFSNLAKASALVTVMHRRGTVTGRSGDTERIRASVWIEQEIAIAAFLSHTRGSKIEIAAYCQKGIALEGVRQHVIANAFEFETEDQILADFKLRLAKWSLSPLPSDEPRLDVRLGFDEKDIESERHEYQLNVALTNTSDVVVHKIRAILDFPRPFAEALPNGGERKDPGSRNHQTHQNFRYSFGTELLPGGTFRAVLLAYEVTDDLYDKYKDKWSKMPVTLKVFVNDKAAGAATKMFSELQTF